MTEKITKQQARFMLDQLKELDRLVHRAYFEMGRILDAFRSHKLWEPLGYNSFSAMIEEELSCSLSSAINYASVYHHCKRLKYSQAETINMIEVIGLRDLCKLLPSMKEKVGIVAMRNRKEQLKRCVSFWVSPEDEARVEDILQKHGMVVDDYGRWVNSSAALLSLVKSEAA